MFAALFAFALVTAHAAEEIPSYIHACGRKDPNYDQCIVENIDNIKSKICSGMPELNVSPMEPIIIDKIGIYDTDNLKLSVKNSKVTGFCNFVVHSVHTNPERLHFDVDVTLNQLIMDSEYDFDIRLLVSLANKGLVHIIADNIGIKMNLDLKEVTKNGKKEIYASKVNINSDIKTFKYEFDDSEKDLVQLHEILSNTINENEKDIISRVKPVLEETFSKLVMTIFNNVTLSRYEQLFPEEA